MEATSAPRSHALRVSRPRRLLAALPDDRLVGYVERGDKTAFEVLYDRHTAGVLGFCRHMLGSVQDAEDAVQHAFIAAHADLQRNTGREIHFKAWLYTIARNRCLSVLRARRDQPSDDVEIVTDRLNDDVQQRDDLRALLADIHKLPGDQREALVLSEVGALTHTEVAEVVGCEVSKVKSLVFQARTALIDRRLARETSCGDIREQIATLRGGALRRSHLRHHLEECPGCTEYREQVRRQRQMLAVALPVVPTAALRGHVMSAVGAGGGTAAAGSAGAGAGFSVIAKTGLAKFGVAALVAGGAAGSAAVVHNGGLGGLPVVGGGNSSSAQSGHGSSGAAVGASKSSNGAAAHKSIAGGGVTASTGTPAGGSHAGSRSPSGTEHGFTPVQGGSNGDAATQRAATLGNGNHTGITKTHEPTPTRAHGQPTHDPTTKTRAPKTNTPGTPNANASPKATPAPRSQGAPKTQSAPTGQAKPKSQPAPKSNSSPQQQPAAPQEPAAITPELTPPPSTAPGNNGKAVGKTKTG